MKNCLFCKMIHGELSPEIIYEDENVLGFKDIHPQSKLHVLFIHKTHDSNINELISQDPQRLVHLFRAIKKYSEESNLAETGFRVVTNLGKDAGQTVFHTHFHVLGGEFLSGFGS